MGAVCAGDSGQLTSVAFSAAQSVQAIRLHTLAQGSVTYEYSIDGGASWHAIRDGRDAWFDVPQRSVQIRANLSGAGTILQGLDVTGVYEMNPVRFKVQLLRPVTSFHLTGGSEFTEAMPAIETDCPAELTTRRLYMDGAWNSNTFTANLLPCEDGSVHTVTALGLEVFVGNVAYFNTHSYTPFQLVDYLDDNINVGRGVGTISLDEGRTYLRFLDIDQPIYNLQFDGLVSDDTEPLHADSAVIFTIEGTDAANTELTRFGSWQVGLQAPRTQVISLDLTGSVGMLTLTAAGYSSTYAQFPVALTFRGIMANAPRALDFSILRFCAI